MPLKRVLQILQVGSCVQGDNLGASGQCGDVKFTTSLHLYGIACHEDPVVVSILPRQDSRALPSEIVTWILHNLWKGITRTPNSMPGGQVTGSLGV